MIDIIDVFKTHCDALGYEFSYGNASNNNLIRSGLDNSKIYFILDPVTRSKVKNDFGSVSNLGFRGSFMLLVQSDFDSVYYNQKDSDVNEGKYEKNIKPLLTELESFEALIDCSDYEITQWEVVDITDVLDVNMDGLLVTYNLRIV